MARNYQYETSPRKLEPEYSPQKKKINKNNEERQYKNTLKMQKRRHHQNIAMIIGIFLLLLVISYRNSLITEKFNEIQDKKNQLASIEKTNGQLEVNIESSLNLNNVEKEAKKTLGMNKLKDKQKVYVTLPKKDYTETSTENIKIDNNENWFQKIINKILNK